MNAVYNEIEPFACDWLERLIERGHVGPGRVERRSITELSAEDVSGSGQRHFFAGIGVWSYALRLAGVPDDASVWTGSCPCQPFSSAGSRGGTSDPRHLWPAWFALIEQCRPAVIFGEQVASKDGLAWLDFVFADLERCGYSVGAADLCAAGIGAPHLRQRLFFVAYADDCDERQWLLVPQRQPRREVSDTDGRAAPRDDGQSLSGMRSEHTVHGLGLLRRAQRDAIALADATSRERRPQFEPSRSKRRQNARAGGGASNVEHAAGEGPQRTAGSLVQRGVTGSTAASTARRMGDAGSDGDREHARELHRDEAQREERAAHSHHASVFAGAVGGFWADAEWIPCRDPDRSIVYRPVEPGTFPLAHGAPARVGRLRGYGNAIVAEVAATFIEAALEARGV